jgi:hypothetical protein
MKWRPSQLGKLMTNSRSKSKLLSETAKSEIRKIAKQDFYGYSYSSDIRTKPMIKGTDWEHEGIKLLNDVRFTNKYVKNNLRVENDYMSGCCDIITDDLIIDIKSSWSLETFPATPSEGQNSDYEWQGRAYMWLYDRPSFELVYTMHTTHDDLLTEWDNLSIHRVNHIPAHHRVTVLRYERDTAIEEQIKERLIACSEYYAQYVNELNSK